MQIFGFDLLPYPEHMDHLKVNGELPYPLPKRHFRPDLAVRNYREHLDAWVRMEELGFYGIGFNEHHTSCPGARRDHSTHYLMAVSRHWSFYSVMKEE